MFRTVRQLKGCSLQAKDGEIGHVKDLYFETLHWRLRYFVVDAGNWLKHRSVLISPDSIHAPDSERQLMRVDLTQQEIRQSPGLETDQPVSRQYEIALRKHYGWPPYWSAVQGEIGAGFPYGVFPTVPEKPMANLELEGDPHLFSANTVIGHHVVASDGEIGHVDDFLIDDQRWTIRYLVVDTRNWWPGNRVILSPWWTSELDWSQRRIHMDLKRGAIESSPLYDPEKPLTEEASGELHDYYGRPRPAIEETAETVVPSDNPNHP